MIVMSGDTSLQLRIIDKDQSIDELRSEIKSFKTLTTKLERDFMTEQNLNKQLKVSSIYMSDVFVPV